MILFEMLVVKGLLTKLLSLLGFMILMQARKSPVNVLLFRGPTSARSNPFRVEGTFSQLNMLLESFQALQVLTFGLCMLIETVTKLVFVAIIQILSFDKYL